jgi:hypothetical protein
MARKEREPKMKTLSVLAVLVVGMCFGAGRARLAVDSQAYSFPDTVEGMAVVHTFVLTNTGDEAPSSRT